MTLKFIGCDGSMGLEHGQVYEVELSTHNGLFWVRWKLRENLFGRDVPTRCAYRSIKSFAKNWALPV